MLLVGIGKECKHTMLGLEGYSAQLPARSPEHYFWAGPLGRMAYDC